VVQPATQYPALPLKTAMSRTAVPIPRELVLELAAHVERWSGEWLLTNELGRQLGPWQLERAIRDARSRVARLPDGFRFHDLRHYLASLLIAGGADIKTTQTRLRHASATTTLRVYAHLWPGADESTRAVVAGVLTARADSVRTSRSWSSQTRRSEA
jgi:integrase